MKRRITAVLLGLLLSIAGCMTGCDKDKGSGAGYLFSYTLTQNPENLDPQMATDAASKTVIGNLFEGLYRLDDAGNVVPALAEQCVVSEDGLTYTFTLRQDCFWYLPAEAKAFAEAESKGDSSGDTYAGTPVTASDFVFAFRRIFQPETHSPYGRMFSCLKNASAILQGQASYESIGVTAPDPHTLVMQLDYANGELQALLASTAAMPCREDFFTTTKGRYGLDEDSVISNGAFYLRMWFYDPYGPDNQISMRRNPLNDAYDRIYPSSLTFYMQDAETENFKSGKTDCLVTPDSRYSSDSAYTTVSYASMTLGLIFNPDDPQYANSSLRKALAQGLNRAEYAEELKSDLAAASGIVPPAVTMLGKSYRELVAEASFFDEDAAAAKTAYTAALQELQTESLKSTQILVPSGLMDYTVLHTIVRRWSDLFGFYIGVEEVTQSEYDKRLAAGDYAIALYALTGERNSASHILEQFTAQDAPFGISEGAATLLTNTLAEIASQASRRDSVEIYRAAESTLLADRCFIPLFYKQEYLVWRTCNADIGFDAFGNQVFFRHAKHFED